MLYFNFSIISITFIAIENKFDFRRDLIFEKGQERFRQKVDANSGLSHQKQHAMRFIVYVAGNVV